MSEDLIGKIAKELRASVTVLALAKLSKLQRKAEGVDMTVIQNEGKWTVVLEGDGQLNTQCDKAELPGKTETLMLKAVLVDKPEQADAAKSQAVPAGRTKQADAAQSQECAELLASKDDDVSTVDLEELFKTQATEKDTECGFKLTHGRWALELEPISMYGNIVQWYASLYVDGKYVDSIKQGTKPGAITELFKNVRARNADTPDAPTAEADDYDAQWRLLVRRFRDNADLHDNKPCADSLCDWHVAAFHVDTDEHTGECVEISYGESELSGYGFTMKQALDRLAKQLENGEGPWPPLAMLGIFETRLWNDAKQDKASDTYEQDGWKLWLWPHKDPEGNAVYKTCLGHGKNVWWSERPCLTRVAAVHSLRERLESLRNDMVRKMSDRQQA